MTNQALIQAKVWKGYSKAALRLGVNYQFHRPSGGSFPGATTVNIPVSLNAEDMKYGKPNKYGKATWYALVDGTSLQVGDYFIGAQGTFFIAALQPLLPILVVECNRTISIGRVTPPAGVGAQSYSGITAANSTPYVSGVPCSILQGTKGEKSVVSLPGDTREPWWIMLMPASVGTVKYGDLVIDDLARRYVVSSAELTDLGYRITAMMALA